MRWAAVEGQDMEMRAAEPRHEPLYAKDLHSVEHTPLHAAAARVSDVLSERYPWDPSWNQGTFDPEISVTQTSVAFGGRAWPKLVGVLREPSSTAQDCRTALVALLNRVARPETRSRIVRAGAVEAAIALLQSQQPPGSAAAALGEK